MPLVSCSSDILSGYDSMARSQRSREMDLLWKHYFRDPSLWHTIDSSKKKTKKCSKFVDFGRKITDESLYLGEWYNPSWVYEELRRTTIVMSKVNKNHERVISIENYKEDFAIVTLLKACAKNKDLCKGTNLHADILRKGLLERSPYVASSLVHMYAKCGALAKAQQVIEGLPYQDVVSWSALIAGFVQHGKGEDALNCYYQMQSKGLSPNAITFTCVLKACGNIGALSEGKKIHEQIVSRGLLEKDCMLGTALVDMYAKCGMLVKAQEVLEQLPNRDVVSWSALIAGYAQQGEGHQALVCFEQMKNEGFSPDSITFICILKACGTIGALSKGKEVHEKIIQSGLLNTDTMLGNALVYMYVKCDMLVNARGVIDELPDRNEVTWNTLIAGYAEHEQFYEAVKTFEEMQSEGFSPDAITLICILKACGNIGAIDKGKKVHDEIVRKGFMKNEDIVLGTALVEMYGKCGLVAKAQQVLEGLPIRDAITWNVLIAAYAQQGQCAAALNCFEQMQSEGIPPDEVIFSCILKVCGTIGAIDRGQQIHEEIEARALLKKDLVLGNALVDMYAKCGVLVKAQEVLEGLPTRDTVTWSTLITGYSQQEKFHESLNCFERMQREGHSPDAVTFICILKACGNIGAIDMGKEIHEEILTRGLFEENIALCNALVDMYSKCGMLQKAHELLDELLFRDIVVWTSLITGHAQQGQGANALACFECLQNEGILPNEVAFLCVLNACCHSGLLIETQSLFENMIKKYNIAPNLEHYTCMLVGLGSAGQFGTAFSIINMMPSCDLQLALLNACRKWLSVELGRMTFDQILLLDNP